MPVKIAAALLMLVLSACTQNAPAATTSAGAANASGHPESGLEVIDLTVTQGSRVNRFRVEVARTPPEQSRGLMFRKAMGADEGMLFPIWPTRYASFWMKNTVLPLDLIFVGPDNRVLNIAHNARPYDETSLASVGKVKAVLELNGGRANALGIGPGAMVSWQEQD